LGNVWFEKTLEGVFDFLLVSGHFDTKRHFEEAQRLRNPTNAAPSPYVISKERSD
jgi:hypothetical protein